MTRDREIYRLEREDEIMEFMQKLCTRIGGATVGWIAVLLCLLDGQHC